ncbi:MAG TPA: tripartite tricarboxylate transporter substrate binding protein [Burkholderiales bacterium]|jgi:tripartite-type tricarboxylate transporter receptor subunit TctC|nr:tripartite tricarboxylate transporter substrate binding protein [Burkholderiales bacterium]
MKFLCTLLFSLLTTVAHAQPFPNRPVTLIVPFSPGTGIDILARVIAPKLSEKWGQAVVVENKAGASGNIGTDAVAKSAPDGYTLMVTVNTFTITPSLLKNTPYDVLEDFSPISKIATATYCFDVNPNVFPARNMQEAIALIRQNPGKYFFASPGNGTPHHIGMELIKLRLGLQATHVPYKGFAGAMQDLIGGQVQMMFTLVHSSIPQARAGRIRILGVTGAKRSPQFPDLPTFREQGIDFMDDVDAWYAVIGPAKLAPELLAKLNADVNAVMALPDVKDGLIKQGLIPTTSTPEELAALIKSDVPRWAKVIADAKITAD